MIIGVTNMSLTLKLTILITGIILLTGLVAWLYYRSYKAHKKHLSDVASGKFAIEKSILRHNKKESKRQSYRRKCLNQKNG
jgi:hypothetical protein